MTTTTAADPEHDHMTWPDIEQFLLHTEQPLERKPLFHVLALCDTCREAAGPLLDFYRRGEITGYVTLLEVELLVSEWDAPSLWRRLEEETLQGETDAITASDLLKADPRWPTWGLAVWLARQSLARADLEPERAALWSYLAEWGAVLLNADDPAPREWIQELRAFTVAASAHVHRVRGNLHEALSRLALARSFLDASDDPADYLPFRPYVYELEADVHRRGKPAAPAAALRCFDEALDAWEVVDGDRSEDRARVQVARGDVLKAIGRVDESDRAYAEAADLLGTSADPSELEAALRKRREDR